MAGVYKLKGVVKHYDWGGYSFIPSLLQMENKENLPFAEYWMGTHTSGKAYIEMKDGKIAELTQQIDSLPYLVKVLDVKEMLSIQVHPTKENAEKEYALENAKGIPLTSPQRNYKDDNHKPEMMVALGDFWLLHGFKPRAALLDTLQSVEALHELIPLFNETGYDGLYKYIMEMPQANVNRILKPLVDNIAEINEVETADWFDEDYWAARAMQTFSQDDNIDRGIFSIYLFNLVHLKKGEGVFQDAGVPHAYLEGQNVEIMSTSDNVLRGGLTSKHIDVKELLKHIKCEPTIPVILKPEAINSEEKLYRSPVDDFQLSVFEVEKDAITYFSSATAEILLLINGSISINCEADSIELQKGSPSAIVMPGNKVMITGIEKATVYRASVPQLHID